MNDPLLTVSEEFAGRLTGAQSQLYACICALLGGTQDARDVLQETNLVLWRKAAEYDPARDFLTWAYAFARFQVLAHLKRNSRDRVVFEDDLFDRIVASVAERNADLEERLRALNGCINQLSDGQRDLLHRRYRDGVPVKALAAEVGKSSTAIGVLLHRIRVALARCVRQATSQWEGS